MGTIRNEMTIVHHCDKDKLEEVREDATDVPSDEMTLDEAIGHAEEVAEEKEKLANTYESFKDYGDPKSSITSGHEKCLNCAREHRQLAKWLKELKAFKELKAYEEQDGDVVTVSRQAVLELVADYVGQVAKGIHFSPPVTTQESTGHWIRFVENNRQHKIKCSKCGYTEPEYATFIRNYCPNCGKRMEKTEE